MLVTLSPYHRMLNRVWGSGFLAHRIHGTIYSTLCKNLHAYWTYIKYIYNLTSVTVSKLVRLFCCFVRIIRHPAQCLWSMFLMGHLSSCFFQDCEFFLQMNSGRMCQGFCIYRKRKGFIEVPNIPPYKDRKNHLHLFPKKPHWNC